MGFFGNITGMRGYMLHVKGKHQQALALYDKANKKGFNNINARMGYSILLLREGRFEEAKKVLTALLREPKLPGRLRYAARVHMALVRWRQDDTEGAIRVLEDMEKDGENTLVYEALGCMYIENGDLERAFSYNEKALSYDESNAVIQDNMGQTLYHMAQRDRAAGDEQAYIEKRDKALEYFEKALSIRPEQTDSWYYKAAIALETGSFEGAHDAIEAGLKCNFSAMSTVNRDMFQALQTRMPQDAVPQPAPESEK